MISGFLRWIVPRRLRPIGYLTQLVRERTDDTVRQGPFAGMRYIDLSVGSAHLPKLLGIYERELGSVIEEVCALSPSLIVDLGAAEGYYAVGLALRNRRARVIAFEREPYGREALLRMTRLNDVASSILIRGNCGPAELQESLTAQQNGLPQVPFILCDVEGDEKTLLDPDAIPALRTAHVLVETHEFVHSGVTDQIRVRFAPTHTIDCVWQVPRSRAEFPFRTLATSLLPSSYLDWAVSEWRPMRMCWLWMKPR